MIARIFAGMASIWFGAQAIDLMLVLARKAQQPSLTVLLLVALPLSGSALLAAIAAGSMERR